MTTVLLIADTNRISDGNFIFEIIKNTPIVDVFNNIN